MVLRSILILFLLLLTWGNGFSQCPQLLDGTGTPSSNPYWVSCSGGNYTLFLQTSVNTGAYTVDFGDGSAPVSGTSLNTTQFISHAYAAAMDTFVVIFTETATGCTVQGVVVLEVTPSASIQIPNGSPVYGCTPAVFSFINSSTNISETTVFTWNFGDGSPILTFDHNNWQDTLTHTYLPGTTNCNVAITLTAENYCNAGNPSSNIYQPIQVWDRDDAEITPSQTFLCYSDTIVHFDNTTDLNCYALGNTNQRFEYWNFGNYWGQGKDSIVDWQPFSPPVRPGYTIAYPGKGTYQVMLIDSSFCGLDTAFVSVTIGDPPVANFTANLDSVCQGDQVTFFNLSTGGNFYSWNFGDGTGWQNTTNTNPRIKTFSLPGTYIVRLIARINGGSGSCADTASMTIVVKPSPIAAFSLSSQDLCDSGSIIFNNTSVDAISWSWIFGNGNTSNAENPPTQFYSGVGNYPVSLQVISANGCSNIRRDTVSVHKSPDANFAANNVCVDQQTNFSDLSTSTDLLTQWSWNFGDQTSNASTQNPSHIYNSPGTYMVKLTVQTAFCQNTDSNSITVNVLPSASFTQDTVSGCTPLNVDFTNTSTGAITYQWNMGNGSSSNATDISQTFANTNANADTTFNVNLIATNTFGCTDTAMSTVTVYAAAVSQFTTSAKPGCSPLAAPFTNQSINSSSFIWDFGDSSPLNNTTNPTHLYNNNTPFVQTYQPTLISISPKGCRDTSSLSVTVYPEVNFSINASPSTSGCGPLTVEFQGSSGGVVYEWAFSNGTTNNLVTPLVTFTNTGNVDSVYTAQLIATNPFNCKDTVTQAVTVHPDPVADFTASPVSQTYPNTIVNMNNLSTGGTEHNWGFGDGTDSNLQSPGSHNYNSWGNYTIRLEVENTFGCRDTAFRNITIIAPVPVAMFATDADEGCEPLKVSFSNTSLYGSAYSWNFGDGNSTTDKDPVYIYYVPGTYIVTLTVTGDGGQSTFSEQIKVNPAAVANFSISPSKVSIPNELVIFYNLSINSSVYQWHFGNGATSAEKDPTVFYGQPGKYDITLIANNEFDCADTLLMPEAVEATAGGKITFPNAFTPSSSGSSGGAYDNNSLTNDIFFPFYEGIKEYNLSIFNRWGELIFESHDVSIGWDGYYRGRLCPQDVYIWKTQGVFSNGSTYSEVGDVTLLR